MRSIGRRFFARDALTLARALLGTVLLHAAGLGLGSLALRRSEKLARATGWAVAACGVVLLAT